MAWDGSGNFSRTNGTNSGAETWQDDDAAGTDIVSDRHDTHDQDLADGIAACITQNNESKPTADFAPNATDTYDLGTSSLKWEDLHLNGVANIGGNLLTDADSTNDIGATGTRWKDLYVDTVTATDSVTIGSSALYADVLETPVATTSGTEQTFTSLPTTANSFVFMIQGLSTNGTARTFIQLGDATTAGYIATGYNTAVARIRDGNSPIVNTPSTGIFIDESTASGRVYSGNIRIQCLDPTNFIYTFDGVLVEHGNAVTTVAGSVTLAGKLDRIRISNGGTDAFDAGSINLAY